MEPISPLMLQIMVSQYKHSWNWWKLTYFVMSTMPFFLCWTSYKLPTPIITSVTFSLAFTVRFSVTVLAFPVVSVIFFIVSLSVVVLSLSVLGLPIVAFIFSIVFLSMEVLAIYIISLSVVALTIAIIALSVVALALAIISISIISFTFPIIVGTILVAPHINLHPCRGSNNLLRSPYPDHRLPHPCRDETHHHDRIFQSHQFRTQGSPRHQRFQFWPSPRRKHPN